ncbi:MAG: hypothetical protein QM582_16040 [Micropruina sp.]|uniref:hypothetical protein n=1 Tax=Micropruina sp. TaxID=2737536 RepID=UPI0039E3145B
MTSQVPEDTPDDGSTPEPTGDADEQATAPAPHRPRPRARWIAALAFIVLAGLIAGIAWLLRPQPASTSVPAATPQQAVSGYLDALVAADAPRALEYALNRPTDTTLLTREMLEASHREAKLTVVNVPVVEGNETVTVPAEVRFGDAPATIAFSVTKTEAGWRLGQVTSTIDPGPLPSELGATINGRPLTDPEHLEVFPGVYVFGEKLPTITLDGGRVTVQAVGEDVRAGLQPVLTAAGKKQASKVAATALKRCLAQKSAAPKDCPNSVAVEKGQKLDTTSIRWNLVGDPWKNATYTLDVADPTHARGATRLTFRFRSSLTQNGEKYTVDQTLPAVDVRYQVSVTNAKDPVAWERVG